MHTAMGIIFGFSLVPACLALIVGYVALAHYLKPSIGDAALGYGIGFALLIVASAVLIRATAP